MRASKYFFYFPILHILTTPLPSPIAIILVIYPSYSYIFGLNFTQQIEVSCPTYKFLTAKFSLLRKPIAKDTRLSSKLGVTNYS